MCAIEKVRESIQDRLQVLLATAIGPEILKYMNDPEVIEIIANDDSKIFAEKLGQPMIYTGINIRPEKAEQVIRLIASHVSAELTEKNPILYAEMPGCGNRFTGVLPKVSRVPIFSIRKRATQIFTLEDYVEQRIMTEFQALCIKNTLKNKNNILIVGGTGSGKTTLANACLQVISETNDRILIIEDTPELQCAAENRTYLGTTDYVTMNHLLRAAMRLRPDRIIVGEVRGAEALTLVKAWNTGHPGGVATVHANSAAAGLHRLELLILENANMTNPQKELIASTVDLIVVIQRDGFGRKVKEILQCSGISSDGQYSLKEIG